MKFLQHTIFVFRIGRKKAIQLSFILVTATAISLAFSPNYIVFVILYFLLGAANAGVFTTRFVIGKSK